MLSSRPYPCQYMTSWTMNDGAPVAIRPIRPDDESLMMAFHTSLSERTVYYRYLQVITLHARIAPARITRICHIDYDQEMVLVADYEYPITGTHKIMGVGRLNKEDDGTGEFAIVIGDHCQGQGLGTEFLCRLMHIGKQENLRVLRGDIHPDNFSMLRVCRKLHFRFVRTIGDPMITAMIDLAQEERI